VPAFEVSEESYRCVRGGGRNRVVRCCIRIGGWAGGWSRGRRAEAHPYRSLSQSRRIREGVRPRFQTARRPDRHGGSPGADRRARCTPCRGLLNDREKNPPGADTQRHGCTVGGALRSHLFRHVVYLPCRLPSCRRQLRAQDGFGARLRRCDLPGGRCNWGGDRLRARNAPADLRRSLQQPGSIRERVRARLQSAKGQQAVNQPEAPGKVLQRLSLVQRQEIQLGRAARCAPVRAAQSWSGENKIRWRRGGVEITTTQVPW